MNWVKLTKAYPEPGRSYLVLIDGPGFIADVAFYEGRRPNGDHWWIHGDINLADRIILQWAEIEYPEDDDKEV